jgi:hypothetical protein
MNSLHIKKLRYPAVDRRARPAIPADFISSERERFTEADNNKFAMSFAQVSRYYAFLQVILKRYEVASRQLFENTRATQAGLSAGTHRSLMSK